MAHLDIQSIKYKYRTMAANALIAKAQRSLFESCAHAIRLNDRNEPIDKNETKRINDAFASIAMYEIAIQFMGHGDPGIYTIINWKILHELSIGQYEDAYKDSMHALEIANHNKDNAQRNATVELIFSRIDELRGKANQEIRLKDDELPMDDPYYSVIGRHICRMMVNGKVKDAYGNFSEELKTKISMGEVRKSLIEMLRMVSDCDEYEYDLISVMDEWPSKKENDFAWLYFSVSGNVGNEAISMIISKAKDNRHVVSEIEFGRP